MSGIKLTWDIGLFNPEKHFIYRSASPISPSNLPTPIAEVGQGINQYNDLSITDGEAYHYFVAAEKMGLLCPANSSVEVIAVIPIYIYSVSSDGTLRKVNYNGQELWSYDAGSSIYSSDFVNDNRLYIGDNNGRVYVVNNHGEEEIRFNTNAGIIRCISVDNDNNIYIGSSDVRKYDSNGNLKWTFSGHTRDVYGIFVDSDNDSIYCAGYEGTLKKLSTSNGNELWTYTGHTSIVFFVTQDAYGNTYSGYDGVKKIDSNGNEVWSFVGQSNITSASIDVNNYLYCGLENGVVIKVDPTGNEVTSGSWPVIAHSSAVYGINVDSKGNVYSGSFDNTVNKIDTEGNVVWTFEGHTNKIYNVVIGEQ